MSTCVVSIYTLCLNTSHFYYGKVRKLSTGEAEAWDQHKFKVSLVHGGVPGQPIQPSEALSQKIKN